MSPEPIPSPHVEQRLRSEIMLWLSSVRPDGRPHLVPVWFLWDAGHLVVFSKPKNQKIRNIRANPNVVVALETRDDGEDVVLIEGRAALVERADLSPTLPAFANKYAALIERLGWTPSAMAAEYSQAIEIVPVRFLMSGG
jgi:PPOX class probable F420-dependent enzyme